MKGSFSLCPTPSKRRWVFSLAVRWVKISTSSEQTNVVELLHSSSVLWARCWKGLCKADNHSWEAELGQHKQLASGSHTARMVIK